MKYYFIRNLHSIVFIIIYGKCLVIGGFLISLVMSKISPSSTVHTQKNVSSLNACNRILLSLCKDSFLDFTLVHYFYSSCADYFTFPQWLRIFFFFLNKCFFFLFVFIFKNWIMSFKIYSLSFPSSPLSQIHQALPSTSCLNFSLLNKSR